jgi:hypothetical protein
MFDLSIKNASKESSFMMTPFFIKLKYKMI